MIQVSGLTKEYAAGASAAGVRLFDQLCFEVHQGEMLAIVGASGSGKSTILHLLAALDHATAGTVTIDGTVIAALDSREQAEFRNRTIGYVWQAHYLLPEFTAVENVAMPLLARGEKFALAREKAAHWLEQVGLGHRLSNRAGELSGGEQQRVSLARALVTTPKVLLGDEPTGNLDAATGESIFLLLEQLHQRQEVTTVLVTHNPVFAQRCSRTLLLRNGRLEDIQT